MKRLTCLLLTLVVSVFAAGCGGDRDKGIYKDQDKPRSAEPPPEKPAKNPGDKKGGKAGEKPGEKGGAKAGDKAEKKGK